MNKPVRSEVAAPEEVDPCELIETMLFSKKLCFLEDHLARLQRSAYWFGFPIDPASIRHMLDRTVARLDHSGRYKVRLTAASDGACSISTHRLEPRSSSHPRKVVLSPHRVDSSDVYLYHKTTRRHLYETEYARASRQGCYEILFFNERDELTEAARANVILGFDDGSYATPPLSSGLLPGVYRENLMRRCNALSAKRLYLDDLVHARRIYVCNAVRGLRSVTLDHQKEGSLR